MILAVLVHSAKTQDREGGELLISQDLLEKYPNLKLLWADKGYTGSFVEYCKSLGLVVEVVKHKDTDKPGAWCESAEQPPPKKKGFRVLKWRWIVERTFGWLSRHRRLSKDYEGTMASSESWILIAMSFLMLRRLAG